MAEQIALKYFLLAESYLRCINVRISQDLGDVSFIKMGDASTSREAVCQFKSLHNHNRIGMNLINN